MPIIKHIPIYAAPKRLLSYVTNEKKTEKTLVTGLNCSVNATDAYEDMKFNFEMFSGERFFKRSIKSDTAKRERQKIRLHHYIQSFKPGEVTPEEAHQIGLEWAESVFGKKAVVLCATHTDRGHIHNHFAVCPYDMDGKHWHANKGSLRRCKAISDEIAIAHGLEIIEHPKKSYNHKYGEYKMRKERKSWKQKLCDDIDDAIIKENVGSIDDLLKELQKQGYGIRRGKYISIKVRQNRKPIRSYRLGDGYALEHLQFRIEHKKMALRMKRAAFIEQKNNEAIRQNRASVVKDEDVLEPQSAEDAVPENTADVPVEHLKDEQEKAYENEYLGNSEHAVFDTFDEDVRAYKAHNAYGKYIGKQNGKALDNIVGGTVGENTQNVISGVSKVGQAVSRSDSVSGSVLDVSSTLAAVEAKKLVKKLAETDLKKEKRAEERMKNHGNRFGIDKYDEVTGKNEKAKNGKNDDDRKSEAPDKRQGGSKVGNSHKLQQEKQEYGKKQRAKEVKGKQKEIFIKENKKIPDTIYSAAVGKAGIAKQLLKKKGVSVILGGGGLSVVLPVLITIVVFVIIMGFFGWLTPFSYGLAGEDPDEEHNAETNAEIIDGYTLMVKNYMDVTQAYYYLNYGDWYGGEYRYENAGLDFGTFFAEYSRKIIKDIQAQFQPLINQARTPEEAQAISQAMGRAISQALSQAQQTAYEEYTRLIGELNDGLTPSEHRQHYEVMAGGGANGTDDSAEFNGKPIVGTNGFGNVEINSELSSEELLSYIALYKSLITMNPDDANAEPDAEEFEPSLNITPQDIMDFFEKTEYISITAEITHNNPCIEQNCKRRLVGDYESGYTWEYYCDGDHDNLTGEIGECLSADELLKKVMELTRSEDIGVDEENCKKILESYIDMFKKELDIDESGFRQFGAKDNAKAMEFYEKLIKDELENVGLWQVNTPFAEG